VSRFSASTALVSWLAFGKFNLFIVSLLLSVNVLIGALTGRLVHPRAPVLLTESGPLGIFNLSYVNLFMLLI
jgi:hypothetical protein